MTERTIHISFEPEIVGGKGDGPDEGPSNEGPSNEGPSNESPSPGRHEAPGLGGGGSGGGGGTVGSTREWGNRDPTSREPPSREREPRAPGNGGQVGASGKDISAFEPAGSGQIARDLLQRQADRRDFNLDEELAAGHMTIGGQAGVHFLLGGIYVEGGVVFQDQKEQDDALDRYTQLCLRFGPGIYLGAGVGVGVSNARASTSDSMGVGLDAGAGAVGVGGRISISGNGDVAVSGSLPRLGLGGGLAIGIDGCVTWIWD